MSGLTSKHFIELADALHRLKPDPLNTEQVTGFHAAVQGVADVLVRANPRFDRVIFYARVYEGEDMATPPVARRPPPWPFDRS